MLKRMLAAMVAVALMAGAAWAGTDYVTNDGSAWVNDGVSGSSTVTVSGSTNLDSTTAAINISSTNDAAASVTIGNVTVATNNVTIGTDSTSVANGLLTVTTGTVGLTAAALNITENATVILGGAMTIGDNANAIVRNAGVLDLGTATHVDSGAGSILNTGTIKAGAGAQLGVIDELLTTNGTTNIGTIIVTAVNAGNISSDFTGATAGTVKFVDQTSNAVSGTADFVGASVEFAGGDSIGGTITAKRITFTGGTNVLTATTHTLVDGYFVEDGAVVQFVDAAEVGDAGKQVTNEGLINVIDGESLKITGNNFTSVAGGIANAGNAAGEGVIIDGASAATATTVLESLARGADIANGSDTTNAIGWVTFADALDGNLDTSSVAIESGTIDLAGNQTTAVDVKVGAADLNIAADGTGTANQFSAVEAASITLATDAVTEFSGNVVTGDLTATENATFKGGVSTIGSAIATASGNIIVDDGATVTVEDVDLSSGDLLNSGGTLNLALAASATNAGLAGDLSLAGGTTNFKTASSVALLGSIADTGDIGTVNIEADIASQAISLGNVSAGTVNFVARQAGTAAIDVGAAAINFESGANNSTFTGNVSATGGINIASATKVGFGGTSTISGAIAVATGGAMDVNGELTTDAITVGEGGSLNFTGASSKIITGDAATDIINLSSNSSINVDDAASSNVILDIGANGILQIDGEAATADKIKEVFNTSSLGSSKDFNLVGGQLTYTGGNIVYANDAARITAISDALIASGNGNLLSGANNAALVTLVNIAEADAAGTLTTAAGQLVAGVVGEIGSGNASAERAAASAMLGFDSAKSLDVAMLTANNVAGRIQGRVMDNNLARARADAAFGSADALGSAMLNCSFANRFWIGGFGLWEDADRRGWDNGYEYKSGGFITGYDRVFGPVTVGGSFAYTAGSYEDRNALASDSDIDSYAFNLYATYNHCSGFFATVLGGYAYSDYDMNNLVTRAGTWERADFHANTWTVGGTIGYDIRPLANLTITPSVGLYHYTSSTNRFNTNIKNNVEVDRDATELPVDLTVNYDIPTAGGNLRLSANTGYAYSFSRDGGELGGFGYNGIAGSRVDGIKGRENARHTWNLGAGLNYQTGRFDFGVKYDYYAKSDYDAHRVLGTVGVSF